MRRLRRALLRGRRADHWYYADDCLILKHPDGRNETEVPVSHLVQDDRMAEHYLRLGDKDWVSRAAIGELRAIAERAVRT